MASSWLIECIRRHFPSGAVPDPVRFRESLAGRLADLRGLNGIRHRLVSLVSVAVAGTAAGHGGPLAIAQAAAGWGQDVLAAHGCRVSPRTGLRVAPSASTLGRLPEMIDPDGFEAALTACVAEAALDPAVPAAYAAHPGPAARSPIAPPRCSAGRLARAPASARLTRRDPPGLVSRARRPVRPPPLGQPGHAVSPTSSASSRPATGASPARGSPAARCRWTPPSSREASQAAHVDLAASKLPERPAERPALGTTPVAAATDQPRPSRPAPSAARPKSGSGCDLSSSGAPTTQSRSGTPGPGALPHRLRAAEATRRGRRASAHVRGHSGGGVETPSFARILDTWTLAVVGAMDSSLAMSRLPRPAPGWAARDGACKLLLGHAQQVRDEAGTEGSGNR